MSLQYRGLVLAYCPDCKKVSVFGSKNEARGFMCRTCNKFHNFVREPAGVFCICECGNIIRGVTNCEENSFEFECKCGYPLAVEYSKKKDQYLLMR